MRLLHTKALQFEVVGTQVPQYAILSHRWSNDEVSYEDLCQVIAGNLPTTSLERIKKQSGYQKIHQFRRFARAEGHTYVWIDTCCIDKRSSAELVEAINSMYQWYQDSDTCYAYLHDVTFLPGPKSLDYHMKQKHPDYQRLGGQGSDWFSRGWTLQEAIASRHLCFVDRSWNKGTQSIQTELSTRICPNFSDIKNKVLRDHEQRFERFGVARRMSWAAGRQTTRVEDRAYSLIGLFDLSMTIIYGEEHRAFQRFQEEVMRVNDDCSILAWHSTASDTRFTANGLARSPDNFAHYKISNDSTILTLSPQPTPHGLRATLDLVMDEHEKTIAYAVLVTKRKKHAKSVSKSLVLPLWFPTHNGSTLPHDCLKFADPLWVPSEFTKKKHPGTVCFLRKPQTLNLCFDRLIISLSKSVWDSYVTVFTYPVQTQPGRRHFPALFSNLSKTTARETKNCVFIAQVKSRELPHIKPIIIVRYRIRGCHLAEAPELTILCSGGLDMDLQSAAKLVEAPQRLDLKPGKLLDVYGRKVPYNQIVHLSRFRDYWLQEGDDDHEEPQGQGALSPITKVICVAQRGRPASPDVTV